MSHFCVVVITGKKKILNRAHAIDVVEPLLAPYDENGTWHKDGSKWDWWTVGGRWTGALDGFDPEADPANYETCFVCGGSGVRKPFTKEEQGLTKEQMRDQMAHCGGCNGCRGLGRSLKFRLNPHDGDVARVGSIREDFVPYAVVTPDGRWYDTGSMGFWGVRREPQTMTDSAWEDSWRRIKSEFAEHFAVLVDCHV